MKHSMLNKLISAFDRVSEFKHGSLKAQVASLEKQFEHADKGDCTTACERNGIDTSLLLAALLIKRNAAQIDEIVHAAGILVSLPHILKRGEVIEYLSLAAGNTGRRFDLETNARIAEFKFIDWKGGAESIRQNQLFKDFFELAESETPKERYLYTVGLKYPLRFFNGRRAMKSVLSKNASTATKFQNSYGERFTRVCEYYEHRKSCVNLVDLAEIVPELAQLNAIDDI